MVILQLIVLQIILQLENKWRWMSPTVPVVPFSYLLASIFFKQRNSLKKHECGVTDVFYVV